MNKLTQNASPVSDSIEQEGSINGAKYEGKNFFERGITAIVFDHSPMGEIAPDTLDLLRTYHAHDIDASVIKVTDSASKPEGVTAEKFKSLQELLYSIQAEIEEFCEKVACQSIITSEDRKRYAANLARVRQIKEVLKHGA